MRYSLIAVLVAFAAGLAACSQPAPVSDEASLLMNALPCYDAVKAATGASSTVSNVTAGATVLATNPACQSVDAATADAIKNATSK